MKQNSGEDGWRGFLELCSKARNKEELEGCFNLFFTIEEKEMLASRYLIVKALLEGSLTQREISEQHQVSIAQITRGSNALKIIHPVVRKFLETKMT